jgi:hypothetical protein
MGNRNLRADVEYGKKANHCVFKYFTTASVLEWT